MPTCPVCGFPELMDPPRSASGGGSYEICPSCGFQFGVDDDDKGLSYEQARERWIAGGMKWHSHGKPRPGHWAPQEQLARLTSGDSGKGQEEHYHQQQPAAKVDLPKASAPHKESAPEPESGSTKANGGKWWAPWKK